MAHPDPAAPFSLPGRTERVVAEAAVSSTGHRTLQAVDGRSGAKRVGEEDEGGQAAKTAQQRSSKAGSDVQRGSPLRVGSLEPHDSSSPLSSLPEASAEDLPETVVDSASRDTVLFTSPTSFATSSSFFDTTRLLLLSACGLPTNRYRDTSTTLIATCSKRASGPGCKFSVRAEKDGIGGEFEVQLDRCVWLHDHVLSEGKPVDKPPKQKTPEPERVEVAVAKSAKKPGPRTIQWTLNWTAKTRSSIMLQLVEQREAIFAKQRLLVDASRQARCEELFSAYLAGRSSSDTGPVSAVNQYRGFCAVAGIPPFPLSPALTALCVFCKCGMKDGWYSSFLFYLDKVYEATKKASEGVATYRELLDLDPEGRGLKEFMAERQGQKAKTPSKRELDASYQPSGDESDTSSSRARSNSGDLDDEFAVAVDLALATRHSVKSGTLKAKDANKLSAPPTKVRKVEKPVSMPRVPVDTRLSFDPSSSLPSPAASSFNVSATHPGALGRSVSPLIHPVPQPTMVMGPPPTLSSSLPARSFPFAPLTDITNLDSNQLVAFLTSLHPSLPPLAPHLLAAGYTSVDALSALLLLDPAILDTFLEHLRVTSEDSKKCPLGAGRVSVIQVKLLAKELKRAGEEVVG